jgi:hypothetical protein
MVPLQPLIEGVSKRMSSTYWIRSSRADRKPIRVVWDISKGFGPNLIRSYRY